ncbi:MAG TPA: nicotinamide riboside transporter PnuC [Ramlibacter sp.]|nr:nicotinamide riboside transporter PnuC [Ramlibacter sp.]
MNDAITLFGLPTTPMELLSFTLAAITVLLTIRQNHWAWLFTIVSSATYAVVFRDAKLYGDMSLQFVFIGAAVWGWYMWLRGGENHGVLKVSRLSAPGVAAAVIAWFGTFLAVALLLSNYTDTDVAYPDAFLTAGSLVGQLLVARKKLENWIIWIIVDVLYVGLYVYKGLMLTAILYALFVVLAAQGLRTWRRSL